MTARKKLSPMRIKLNLIMIFAVLAVVLICIADLQIRPVLFNLAEYRGKQIITDIFQEETKRLLEEDGICYQNLSCVTYSADGIVSSVETNTVLVNIVQSKLTSAINKRLETLSAEIVEIPMGTVSGISILHGRGPKFKVRITPTGTVDCNIQHEFVSGGVNQTCHRLYFTVSSGAKAMIPASSEEFHVETNCLLAETIIVGEVPPALYSYSE